MGILLDDEPSPRHTICLILRSCRANRFIELLAWLWVQPCMQPNRHRMQGR